MTTTTTNMTITSFKSQIINRLLTVLLLIFITTVPINATNNNDDDDDRPPIRKGLTISEFNTILMTDVTTDTTRHIDDNDSNTSRRRLTDDQWDIETVQEWQKAWSSHRRLDDNNTNRTTTTMDHPYIICDMTPHKSGYDVRQFILSHLPSSSSSSSSPTPSPLPTTTLSQNLTTLYNGNDKSCYLLTIPARTAHSLPLSLTVQPLLPRMKINEGTNRMIENTENEEWTRLKTKALSCQGVEVTNEIMEVIISEWNNGITEDNDILDQNQTCPPLSLYSYTLHHSLLTTLTLPLSHLSTPTCTLSFLTHLSLHPAICSISTVSPMRLFNIEAQWIVQSGVDGERPFFDEGLTGRGQVVACSDTGLDLDNCYFRDDGRGGRGGGLRTTHQINTQNRKVIQYIPHGDSSDYTGGHGTHVAGTIIGRKLTRTTENTGLADGIARDAKLAFFDIHSTGSRELSIPEDDLSKVLETGWGVGARIHSASWGRGEEGAVYGDIERQFDAHVYDNPELLVVVAAGNTGASPGRIDISSSCTSPGVAKNVLTVGASQSSGPDLLPAMRGPDYIASFSSRGPTFDGRIKPDVIAPGYHIRSAKAQPEKMGECDETDGTMILAGTSMAVPVVSGSAALVRQYLDERLDKKQPSAALVKGVIMNGGVGLEGVQNERSVSRVEMYDGNQGFGRVNMKQSLPLKDSDFDLFLVDREPIRQGQVHEYLFTIRNDDCRYGDEEGSFSVTLVWTDPPAAPSCRKCLINDLDLEVTTIKDRRVWYPNGRNDKDEYNNVERIRLDGGGGRRWERLEGGDVIKVTVMGYDLDTVEQEYALVATGCFIEGGGEGEVETGDDDSDDNKKKRSGRRRGGDDDNSSSSDDYDDDDESLMMPEMDYIPPSLFLTTTFDGESKHDGNMFDVVAKNPIIITQMDIHTIATSSVTVHIWTKEGTLRDNLNRENAWTKILTTTITGRGINQPTPLPPFSTPLLTGIDENTSIRSFYVTFEENLMVMSRAADNNGDGGGGFGSVAEENEDLRMLNGIARSWKFGRSFSPWQWNGILYYRKL